MTKSHLSTVFTVITIAIGSLLSTVSSHANTEDNTEDSALSSGAGVLCYTGYHEPTVTALQQQFSFIGHTPGSLDNQQLFIHLSDGNLAEEVAAAFKNEAPPTDKDESGPLPPSWCFQYPEPKGAALYNTVKSLGWLGKANAVTTIREGDFLFRHSGSGRVVAYDLEGYQQAAKAVVAIKPSYLKEVYLLDGSSSAARITPEKLNTFAKSGSAHLEMLNANAIVADYYDRFYGVFRHTSPAGYGATTGLIFVSMYAANLGVFNSLLLSPIAAFGVAVVAPPYLIPEKSLEKMSPNEVPASTLLALGGYGYSALGSALEQAGTIVSSAGDSFYTLSQPDSINSWKALLGIIGVGLTPQVLRLANWVSYGYLGMAGRIFFGGALFAAGTGAGLYALLGATDWYRANTDWLNLNREENSNQ